MTEPEMQPEIEVVDEADAYDEAGDKAAAEGQHNSAELFYTMAADERIEAERG